MKDAIRPLILLALYPRFVYLIFDVATRARLETFREVVWHEGTSATDEQIDGYLPRAVTRSTRRGC